MKNRCRRSIGICFSFSGIETTVLSKDSNSVLIHPKVQKGPIPTNENEIRIFCEVRAEALAITLQNC
jgi:hypothetical protein